MLQKKQHRDKNKDVEGEKRDWWLFQLSHDVFSGRMCAVSVLLAREDVDSRTTPIRIKANSIRGQRRALLVEIALPLLRENIEKPPHRLNKTINLAK